LLFVNRLFIFVGTEEDVSEDAIISIPFDVICFRGVNLNGMFEDVTSKPRVELIPASANFILPLLSSQSSIATIENQLRQILNLQVLADPIHAREDLRICKAGSWSTT
jgi:hypothetical protein